MDIDEKSSVWYQIWFILDKYEKWHLALMKNDCE